MREGGFGKGTELEEKLRERHTDPGHRQAMMTGGRKGARWPMRGDAEKSFFFTPRNVRLEGLHATGSVGTHTRLAFFVWILEGELAVQLRETLVPTGKHEKVHICFMWGYSMHLMLQRGMPSFARRCSTL